MKWVAERSILPAVILAAAVGAAVIRPSTQPVPPEVPAAAVVWQDALPGKAAFQQCSFLALQRTEMPVINFSADTSLTMDVSVLFPQELTTQWHPDSSNAGPTTHETPTALAQRQVVVTERGLPFPSPTASDPETASVSENQIVWKSLRIFVDDTGESVAALGAPACRQ